MERPADVAVRRVRALRAVHIVEAHVPDREAQLVESTEHLRERSGDVPVHDELPRARTTVEAPVGHGEEP